MVDNWTSWRLPLGGLGLKNAPNLKATWWICNCVIFSKSKGVFSRFIRDKQSPCMLVKRGRVKAMASGILWDTKIIYICPTSLQVIWLQCGLSAWIYTRKSLKDYTNLQIINNAKIKICLIMKMRDDCWAPKTTRESNSYLWLKRSAARPIAPPRQRTVSVLRGHKKLLQLQMFRQISSVAFLSLPPKNVRFGRNKICSNKKIKKHLKQIWTWG